MPNKRSRDQKLKDRAVKPISNEELVYYVIYARRSQEDDEKQKESIPQQLEKCLYLSEKDESVNLQLRNTKNFPLDEQTLIEIENAYAKDSTNGKKVRDFYLKYTVITERKSAKTPYKRAEWGKLMDAVEAGVVRGICSYAPTEWPEIYKKAVKSYS